MESASRANRSRVLSLTLMVVLIGRVYLIVDQYVYVSPVGQLRSRMRPLCDPQAQPVCTTGQRITWRQGHPRYLGFMSEGQVQPQGQGRIRFPPTPAIIAGDKET